MTRRGTNALLARAIDLHQCGRIDDAIPLYRDVLRRDPAELQAHNNLAAAYSALNRFEEAARCYRRLLKLTPGDARSLVGLGNVLQQMGQEKKALEQFARAYLQAPDSFGSRARLVGALRRGPASLSAPQVGQAVAMLADDQAVLHQRLVPVAANLLMEQQSVRKALQRLEKHGDLTPGELVPQLYRALSQPLPRRLFNDHVFSDAAVETLVTALRRVWLQAFLQDAAINWPQQSLLSSLALQAQTTEWVYVESDDERNDVARLQMILRGPDTRFREGRPSRELLLYALYRPLDEFSEDSALREAAASSDGSAIELLRRHLTEPLRERVLEEHMARLTPISGGTSTQVRQQYEQRPYPRWRSISRGRRWTLSEFLRATLRNPDLACREVAEPRVLVAGCGTGRHAIATARRLQGAQILAIDFSLTSLSFAARQAEDLGVENIRFAQADILELGDFDERFDLVECVGVLHHMADPEMGWAILRRLLKPVGLMRLGLYSRRGRRGIDQARSLIKQQGLSPDTDDIRKARAAILTLPADALARQLAASPDFYSLSGCRDMFFHAHEDRFDLPRIGRALEELDLEFLGFELPDERIRELYRRRFSDDEWTCNLHHWDQLEADHPNLFAAMYRFWCRS